MAPPRCTGPQATCAPRGHSGNCSCRRGLRGPDRAASAESSRRWSHTLPAESVVPRVEEYRFSRIPCRKAVFYFPAAHPTAAGANATPRPASAAGAVQMACLCPHIRHTQRRPHRTPTRQRSVPVGIVPTWDLVPLGVHSDWQRIPRHARDCQKATCQRCRCGAHGLPVSLTPQRRPAPHLFPRTASRYHRALGGRQHNSL